MNEPDNHHILYQHNKQLRASIEVQQKDINEIHNLGKFQQHPDFQSNNFYSINSPQPPLPKSQNTSLRKKHQSNVTNKLKKIANIQATQRQVSSTNSESPMHRSLSQPRNFVAHQFGHSNNLQLSQKFSQAQQQPDSHKVINNYKMNYLHQKSQSQHANRRIAFQNQKRVHPTSQNVNQTVQDVFSPAHKFDYRQSQSDSDRLNFFAKGQNYQPKRNKCNRQIQIVEQKEGKSKRSQQEILQSNGRPRLKVQKSRKSVGLRKTPSNSKLQQNSIISNQGSINQANTNIQVQSSKRGLLESRQSKFNRAIQPKNQNSSRTKTYLKSVFNSKESQQNQANNVTIATSVPQNNSNHSISHNFQFQTHHHQESSGSSICHPHHSYVKKIQNSHSSRPSGSIVKSVGKIREPDIIMQKQNYIHTNNNSVPSRSTSPNSRKKMIKHRSKTSFNKDQSLSAQNGTHLMMNDIESVVNPNHEFKIDTPKIDVLHTSKPRRPSQILSFNQEQGELKPQILSGLISTTSKKSERIKLSRQPLDGNKNTSQPGAMIYPGSTKASRAQIKQQGQHLLPDIPAKSSSIMYMNATGSTTSSGVKASSVVRRAGYLEGTPLPETNFTTQSKRKLNNIKNPSAQGSTNNSEVKLNFRGGSNLSKDLFGSRQIKTPRTSNAQKIESNTHLQRSQSINVPSQQQYHHQHHHHYNSVSNNLLENSPFKSQSIIRQTNLMPSLFGEELLHQPSYPQTTKHQTSKIIAFKKINRNLTNTNNNSAIIVQTHQYKQPQQQHQPSIGAMPFSLNQTLAACEPNINSQAGEVLGKTSMGGCVTRRFDSSQENYVSSTCNRLTSVSNSPTSQNQRKLRKQKEYLAKNVNFVIPKDEESSSQQSAILEQSKFLGILGGSHNVSQHQLNPQDGCYEQQLDLNRIEQVESVSFSQSPDISIPQKQSNLISLKSIISPNNGAKAVETIHQENQVDSQFSTLIGKSLHKSLSNNNGLQQQSNFQTLPNQNLKNVQQPKMNSIPESYNSSIQQNLGGTSSNSICSSHRTPGKRVQPSQQGKKGVGTPYTYKIEETTHRNQKPSTGKRYYSQQLGTHYNIKLKSGGKSDEACRIPVGMINLHSQHNIEVSQFSPLTAFSSDQSDTLAPFCFSGEEYTPTNSPSPEKRRMQTEQDLISTGKFKHNATSGTGGLSTKLQHIRSPSTQQTKKSRSKKRSDFYSSGGSCYQFYPNFNGSGSILRDQASIKFHKNQQQQSIGEQNNVFQKRHDVSYAEQESFLQHVEARLHQLQFQMTFKKQKKQKQLSNMGDMGRLNRNKIIQKMTHDSIFQRNMNSHNERNSPLKSSNCMKISSNIKQTECSQIDMDILENYSFEIERINNLEIPKNVSQPLYKLDVAVVPSKECQMYNQILLEDGRIQFRPDTQKILITTNATSNFQNSRLLQSKNALTNQKQFPQQSKTSSISPNKKSNLNERAQKKQKQYLQMLQKQRQDNSKKLKSSQYHSHLSKVLQKKVQEAKNYKMHQQQTSKKVGSLISAQQLNFSFTKLEEEQTHINQQMMQNKNDVSLKLDDLNQILEQEESTSKTGSLIKYAEVFLRDDGCEIWDSLDCNILRENLGVKSGEFPLLLPCLQEMGNMDLGLNLCSANFLPLFKAPNEEPALEFFPFPIESILLNK